MGYTTTKNKLKNKKNTIENREIRGEIMKIEKKYIYIYDTFVRNKKKIDPYSIIIMNCNEKPNNFYGRYDARSPTIKKLYNFFYIIYPVNYLFGLLKYIEGNKCVKRTKREKNCFFFYFFFFYCA